MGCDIHWILEVKEKHGWLGLATSEITGRTARASDRDYLLFAKLAPARLPSKREALGSPDDASRLTRRIVSEWEGDGHNLSHISVKEYIRLYNSTVRILGKKADCDAWDLFGYPIEERVEELGDDMDNYRLIFFFDN